VTWGKTAQAIPQVQTYTYDEDDRIRAGVALAYGEMIAGKTLSPNLEPAFAQLENLSRDRAPLVRKAAIQALGKLRSETVIPFLTPALQDSDLEIVALASQILQNYKTYSASTPDFSEKKLPENSALKAQRYSILMTQEDSRYSRQA